ncbi:MAG: hypothetical protein FWF15_06365 [Oscillospiraceae bacterium]|nr:hypothetical protein [Oscillospiraceae bacterium]
MFKKILTTIIYPACSLFTVCIFITTAIASSVDSNMVPDLKFMAMLFVFSLLFALINKILTLKIVTALKFLLHFVLTLIDFILMFIVVSGYYLNGPTALFIIICFILVYAIIMGATMLIRGVFQEKKKDKSEYKKMF